VIYKDELFPGRLYQILMNRSKLKEKLQEQLPGGWDIIIVGGGATGLGIALDAARRGYKILLLEKFDIAKGTSSHSTKLVHGGVRYMAQGNFILVLEALRERGFMLRNAPYITFIQEFVIPVYTIWDVVKYTLGLKLYDFLSGKLSIGKSYFISSHDVLKKVPQLIFYGLKGGIVYYDGQFDDSRMAFSLANACLESGALVFNYFEVIDFIKDEYGRIKGVKAIEKTEGKEYILSAGLVINATGVFSDEITRMDDCNAKPAIKPSQGVHIVLDSSFIKSNIALMIPKTTDGRVLFMIPWYGKLIVGTTDTPVENISIEPVALDSEIDFILQTAGNYLVRKPKRDDILCVYAGLRPLAADPDNPLSTKEVSRRHKITLSKSGLLSVIGGKWTTYRLMAEETIDFAIKKRLLIKRKSVTKSFQIDNISPKDSNDRLKIYGRRFHEIKKMIEEDPKTGLLLDPRLPYTKAEIIWICKNEMVVTLEDLLARRTRSLFLDASASREIAGEAAKLMATELGFDILWQKEQTDLYNQLVKKYL
jgi:glycerol-3-phosphate dehydrogenase